MPKKKKKKSWKERQRERHTKQQKAQEARRMRKERETKKRSWQWPKGKILGAVCLLVLIFGAIWAWQYIKPFTILEEPPPTGGAIYVRADGSVEPLTANITSADNVTYTFTDNNYDSIILEKDNIVINGSGYTLQGTGIGTGFNLTGRSNVKITNVKIEDFDYGVYFSNVSYNVLSQNNLTNNNFGVILEYSNNNNISGNTFFNCGVLVGQSYENVMVDNLVNSKPLVYLEGVSNYAVDNAGQVILVSCTNILVENLNLYNVSVSVQLWETSNTNVTNNNITNSKLYGVYLYNAFYNVLSQNNVTDNRGGIILEQSFNNTLSGNNVANNQNGIVLYGSSFNKYHHNNFIDNAEQVFSLNSTNVWDDGYPSGGNYWSNYTGVDLDYDGIGDVAHIIDANNTDNYPLMGMHALTMLVAYTQATGGKEGEINGNRFALKSHHALPHRLTTSRIEKFSTKFTACILHRIGHVSIAWARFCATLANPSLFKVVSSGIPLLFHPL